MNNPPKKFWPGFNLVELVIGLVIILVAADLVIVVNRTHKATNRDAQREALVNSTSKGLEDFYNTSGRGFYPSLADLNDPSWVRKYITTMSPMHPQAIRPQNGASPTGTFQYTNKDTSSDCTDANSSTPPSSGCGDFTLAVKLENGSTYSRSSLNGQ